MIIPALLIALSGLALTESAQAYVPPSFFIVRTLAHKHALFDEGRFRSRVTFYKKSGETAFTLNESLVLPDPEHAVVRLTDPAGNEVVKSARRLIGARGGDLGRPVLYDLLYIKDGGSIFEHLRQLGLPLRSESALYADKEGNMPYKPESTVALDRIDGKVAVVVGDRTKKGEFTPSLWIDKDSGVPIRAIFAAPEAGGSPASDDALEFRMSGYSMYKAFLYPRVVQIFRGRTLWAKIETQEARSVGASSEDASARVEPDGDLKENVDAYLKWVR